MYKEELIPYRRPKESGNDKQYNGANLFTMTNVVIFLCTFFVARVFMLNLLMPFGLGMFIAAYKVLNKPVVEIVGLSAIIGYLSTLNGHMAVSHSFTIFILMVIVLLKQQKDKYRVLKLSMFAFIINITIGLIVSSIFSFNQIILNDVFIVVLDSIIAVALGLIFSYGLTLIVRYNKRKILSKEEMICINLMLAVAIAGMWNINIYGFSIRNMLTFFIVIVLGYVEGPGMGAAAGATLGLIPTISDASMPVMLGIYSFCGLISGIFRDMGKIITAASFVISAAVLSFYTAGIIKFNSIFLDAIIPSIVFIIIPSKNYTKLEFLVNAEKRDIEMQKFYVKKVKDLIDAKLKGVSSTLSALSEILQQNIDNQLSNKIEVTSLVEKLADKVCTNCECREICWKKEAYYTYGSFNEMYSFLEKTGRISVPQVPDNLKKKCIRLNELIKQGNYMYEIFRLNNHWKKRLINSRTILSDQINGISALVEDMIGEVAVSMEFKNDIEEEIAVELDKKGLEFDNVLAVKNNRGKYEVSIYRKPCLGQNACNKDFAGVVSKVLGVRMDKNLSQCTINHETSICQFRLLESPVYNVTTIVAKTSKEEISGDTSFYGEISEGRYMVALSDGMGSGCRASIESKTTISLLEKFIEAGFEQNTAIKAINSILAFRSVDENYATIDVALIDLYNGICEFIKIGSVSTFIVSGMEIDTIKSSSLPVGILENVDVESEIVQLKNGDIIVTISDGIADANNELKELWVKNELKTIKSGNPKDIADTILKKAKEYYGNKVKDDMTVMVSKVWKNL